MRSLRGAGNLALPGTLLAIALGTVCAGGMAARYGLGWPRRVWQPRPRGIVIHHSASPGTEAGRPVDAALIDRWHAQRGWGQATVAGTCHIGYHYVILPDGSVEVGRPEWMQGAHTVGHNDCLGICLVGNFSSSASHPGTGSRPTRKQLDALVGLLVRLLRKHGLKLTDVHRHRDLAPTVCPGDRLPFEEALQRVKKALAP